MKDERHGLQSGASRIGTVDARQELETAMHDSVETIGDALRQRPVLAVAIGVGIGLLLARVLGD